MSNHPETYQSYKNAIQFAKRTKIDDKDKQLRIQRQFLKYFNLEIDKKTSNTEF